MEDMLSGQQEGDSAYEVFMQERLQTGEKDIFAPITKKNLKTFVQRKADPKKQKILSVKASRSLTTRILIASKVRDISLRSVLKFNLSDIPPALGNDDGTMTKTDKSRLAAALLKLSGDASENMTADVTIIDGMALVHQQLLIPKTFGELAKKLLNHVIAIGRGFGSHRIDFVGDRYPQHSIKGQERERRSRKEARHIHITRPSQDLPVPFSVYLSSGHNKEIFLDFLGEQWKNLCNEIPRGLEIFIGCGLVCQKITHGIAEAVPELSCDHEKADTRMLLHAKHASASGGSIIMKSPDTDVLVLTVGLAAEMDAEIFMCMGSANIVKNINASSLSRHLGGAASCALIGLHCLTGCDSVSQRLQKQREGERSRADVVHQATPESLCSTGCLMESFR